MEKIVWPVRVKNVILKIFLGLEDTTPLGLKKYVGKEQEVSPGLSVQHPQTLLQYSIIPVIRPK